MNKLKITLLSLVTMTTACTNEIDETSIDKQGQNIIVEATIGESMLSRAAIRTDDGISYDHFENPDQIGLYANPGTTSPITNISLEHNDKVFQSNNLQWTGGEIKNIYAYFPYSATPNQVTIWRDAKNETGKIWKDGFEDVLAANIGSVTEGNVIRMNFTHQFMMLVIKRGEGFKNATDKEVKIQLNKKVSHTAGINTTSHNLELKEDNSNGTQELEANPGKYQAEDVDYVIVPIDMNGGGLDVNVTSITLYNDLGRQVVVPYSVGKRAKNTKFVVTVKMLNNQAIVSPEEIVQWDNENIHFDIPAGINNEEEFMEWASTYNDTNLDEKTRGDKLVEFGSFDNSKWTFRLLDDIDLSTESFNGITDFKDIFDGQGYSIIGLNIKEETGSSNLPTGFVRTLSGTIQRLILEDAVVYGQTEIGAFAGKATSGAKIENCKLTGASIIFGTSDVGDFIGKNDAGADAIVNCSKSSTVIVKVK